MIVNIDIETVPQQGTYEHFLKSAIEGYKAPSGMTKTKALEDLKVTDPEQIKSISKDDAIKLWEHEFAEENSKEVADYEWRRTALDAAKGEIFSISWAVEDQEIESVYREVSIVGDQVILSSEKEMLVEFFVSLTSSLLRRPPMFVGQNVGAFDLKFIFQRSVILGVKPAFPLPFNGRHNFDFFDTQIAWAGFKGRMSQDNLCKALGIEGKPDDIDGSKVWDAVAAGNGERVVEYNRDDVFKNREIYKRLNFIDSIRGLAKAA